MRTVGWISILCSFGFTLFPLSCPAEPSYSFGLWEASNGTFQVVVLTSSQVLLESEEPAETIPDPFEPVNRAFFKMNDKLYFWVFKPVATGYKAIAPQAVRVGLRNAFSNLTTPVRLVNCLLQAEFKGAGNEAVRFLLNSTFGIAGFLDLAKRDFDIEKQDRDFGQTLGVWGIGPAFYIDWPVLGPSSLRDTAGLAGDLLLDPRTYLISSIWIDAAVWSAEKINGTSFRIGEYESLKEGAIDPYIALREAYHQYRQSRIRKVREE
jgi:phospholipid-binding lipoprotein MlaA